MGPKTYCLAHVLLFAPGAAPILLRNGELNFVRVAIILSVLEVTVHAAKAGDIAGSPDDGKYMRVLNVVFYSL